MKYTTVYNNNNSNLKNTNHKSDLLSMMQCTFKRSPGYLSSEGVNTAMY